MCSTPTNAHALNLSGKKYRQLSPHYPSYIGSWWSLDKSWCVLTIGHCIMHGSQMIVGPLLWHWENNNTNDLSIELDLEEVKALARKIGFEISVSPRTLSTSQ